MSSGLTRSNLMTESIEISSVSVYAIRGVRFVVIRTVIDGVSISGHIAAIRKRTRSLSLNLT